MPPTEIASERRPGRKMRRPVDPTDRPIERLSVRDFEAAQFEEHTIGDSRLEARPISDAQVPSEGNAGGTLLRARGTEGHQLPRQQIGQSPRRTRDKLTAAHIGTAMAIALIGATAAV